MVCGNEYHAQYERKARRSLALLAILLHQVGTGLLHGRWHVDRRHHALKDAGRCLGLGESSISVVAARLAARLVAGLAAGSRRWASSSDAPSP